MAKREKQSSLPGLLPILGAVTTGDIGFDLGTLDPLTITEAVKNGLGAILAHISRNNPVNLRSALAEEIRAADLTARIVTADTLDAIRHILRACDTAAYRPLLIKGAAVALIYYPEAHLRTMGDVDVCVPLAYQADFEAKLRALGFIQTSPTPAEFYERHHHSMPFWHRQWGVWVEVHTRLFPPNSLLADDSRFALESIEPHLHKLAVQGGSARAMNSELQLLYTCTRWMEGLNIERGIFPMLDVALLMRNKGYTLDWDKVFLMLRGSSAAATTAMHTMLSYLCHRGIVSMPPDVLARLAVLDQYTNRVSLWILHRLISIFLIERKPYGPFLTENITRIIWSALLQTPTPFRNLLKLPYHIAFPPDQPRRFDLARAGGRLRSFVRRTKERKTKKGRNDVAGV